MTEGVRTATRPVSPALEKTRTSVQNVQKVCPPLKWSVCVLSGLRGYAAAHPALLRWRCLLFLPPAGRFLTAQQTCVSKCPAGFFASRLSGVCEACPPGCLQCADAQHCTRCQSIRKAQLFLQDGQCVQQCLRWAANPVTACLFNSNLNVFACFLHTHVWVCAIVIWKSPITNMVGV